MSFGAGGNGDCVAAIDMLSGSFSWVMVGGEPTAVVEKTLGFTVAAAARAVSKCRVTLTVLPAGNFAAHAAMSADGSPVAALNSAIVLSGKTPSFTVWWVV